MPIVVPGALESLLMKIKVSLHPLAYADYLALRQDAQVIEQDEFGDKVLLKVDGSYIKLFRRKRLLSSAAWRPYARRFAENAFALHRLGIPCPRVIAAYKVASIERDLVHYHALEGETVRQVIQRGLSADETGQLRTGLARFVGLLHDKGVYFRSLHLGNIVLTDQKTLGLIDIADMVIGRRLGAGKRQRNIRHMLRYTSDCEWLGGSEYWQGLINEEAGRQ